MTSPILETTGRVLFHTLVVFSLFLLFAGHNDPGGGFIGGLVAGAALVLRYLAEGSDDLARVVPAGPAVLLGAGLASATGAGVVGLAAGDPFLANRYLEAALPVLGTVKVATVLLFDIGVYLIVIGMVLALLVTLGSEAEA